MWVYSQSRHTLTCGGIRVSDCYSGNGAGLNNAALQNIERTGPIPRGYYDVGEAFTHPHLGPITMRLTPVNETDTFGRSGFCIHGDNSNHNGSASEECIVVRMPSARKLVADSKDRVLVVIE